MNIYDFLFIVLFLGLMGISLYKLFNLMSAGEVYDYRMTWILYIGFIMAWGGLLLILLLQPERLIYVTLFKFSTFFMGLNTLFLIAELFLGWNKQYGEERIEAYKPIKRKY